MAVVLVPRGALTCNGYGDDLYQLPAGDYPSARLLFKELESQFATFFDERIDPGAMWPQVIQEEAEECAIMLVVIGPQWLAKENLERLRDPNDWVRRELQTTLGKANAVRVVPVLCNGARLPTADELPEALVSIPTLQAANLLQWDSDVAALIKKLQSWLSGRSPERVARAPFPRILPYLCDRIEQEEGVQDLVEPRPSGVFACVLHGESLEGHDGFVDRLVYRRLFDRLFRAKDKGVAVTRLDWNRRDAQRGNYANVLRRALGRALETSGSSSDDLLQRLLAPGQPRILVLQVASADYAACGTHLVDRIVAAWFELFGTPAGSPRSRSFCGSTSRVPSPSTIFGRCSSPAGWCSLGWSRCAKATSSNGSPSQRSKSISRAERPRCCRSLPADARCRCSSS